MKITALSDGTVPQEWHVLLRNTTNDKTDALLERSFLSNPVEASINAFLFQSGDRLVLVDTGAGELFGPGFGDKLVSSLASVGVAPEHVTDILLTHAHSDHMGGLVHGGKLTFPNATAHLSKADLDFFLDRENSKRTGYAMLYFDQAFTALEPCLKAGKIKTFVTTEEVLPGVTPELHPGHTPGTAFYTLRSHGQEIVFIGDIIHVASVQAPDPEITIIYDVNPAMAAAVRHEALSTFADHRTLVAAPHLPFPGVGHFRRMGSAFEWVPVAYGNRVPASDDNVVRTADPIKRGFKLSDFPRTVQVSPNVYAYEDFHAGAEKFTTTNMFVVTSEGVLLCDAQGDPEATRKEVEAIGKITTHPIKWVVIASDHGDHTGGNSSLPAGVTFFIHPNSKGILDKQAANAKRAPSWTLPADAVLVPEKKVLKPGSEEVEILFLGRSHTGGDLAVYLPRQKILFLSEIFFNRVFPAMRSAYPSEWLKALDRAEEIDKDVYIPGHGFTEKAAVSKEELYEYHRALKAVIDEATRLYKAGVPVEEAVKQANWGEYSSWTLASSQGPIAVRKVYEELNGKLH